MNGKHNCVEKRTDWSISMELDQEKQNQEAAERCRALAQRVVRELAPRSVQVLEDSGLLEKAFCKMNTAVVQSAPELLVVADPQWVTLPAVQAEKVLLVCAEYAGMADCAKQLAAQGFCRELAWKDRGKEQLTALFRDLRTKCDSGEISTKALDLRGLLAALHLIEKGIPSGQALDLGIINKAFEPFERQLVADAVWARLPRDATRDKLFD